MSDGRTKPRLTNQMIHDELAELRKTIVITSEQVTTISDSFRRLEHAILGDDTHEQWGYKHRIGYLEAKQKDIERRMMHVEASINRFLAYAVGAGTVTGLITSILAWIISNSQAIQKITGG